MQRTQKKKEKKNRKGGKKKKEGVHDPEITHNFLSWETQ